MVGGLGANQVCLGWARGWVSLLLWMEGARVAVGCDMIMYISLCNNLDCYVLLCCRGMCVCVCVEKTCGGGGMLAGLHMCLRTSHPRPTSPLRVRVASKQKSPLWKLSCGNTRLSMAGAVGPIRKAWYQWKMKRFPWRKKWLVGECWPRHRLDIGLWRILASRL